MLLFFAVCFSLFLCQQSSLAHTVSMSALKISKWQSSHCSKIFSGLSASPSNVIFTLCPMCFCRAFHKSISRSIILYHSVKRQPFFFVLRPVCATDLCGYDGEYGIEINKKSGRISVRLGTCYLISERHFYIRVLLLPLLQAVFLRGRGHRPAYVRG